ncbi:hypothetical protein LTR10_021626 [Elasticomyces elasticus]|uniref:ADP-ribosylation factor GTPase-activating protein n=1 Tax=Exophiala sideris TaxID=1016849 RepID=A0ABR0J2M9_9EURO|nr:hypothetical protein LTR10_021626 [Elasticomyces elasticus]KAK5024130.1 hypothetical protein LTS07_008865 [Exophiala sideris]KAK5029010.1 hypothetical protein LTR13_008880 [Exophiala sideris]KAK5054842.1 hypothetical protein LTR69_008750 [Exophiala sideris]KAK5178833.1 hypothetical protein LTR44_008661 [Eurotiomycetes sp. CCFEE 6388]
MGNIGSKVEDGPILYLKDQARFSITSIVITNGRRKVLLHVTPNAYPASRLVGRPDAADYRPISYIQDPESSGVAFLPRLDLEDELDVRFTFTSRQNSGPLPATPSTATASVDTTVTGLTFAYAPNAKELDNLVTREFHADPNLHKNDNVQFIGEFATNGNPVISYEWNWRWKPPKIHEDKGGGWRNCCSFLEYDSRAHRLNTLASFSFWVNNAALSNLTPLTSPSFELRVPSQRHRLPSNQSFQSAVSDSEGHADLPNPPSPHVPAVDFTSTASTAAASSLAPSLPVIDVQCPRPGEDVSAVEDGPVFRATMKSLEQKTGSMRIQVKKVLKKAEAAQQAQVECNQAMADFLRALQEASASNATAFKPALDHYFTNIAQRILKYEKENSSLLQRQIIDPISKLYQLDIKQAEAKKKDFEDESRDYYAYVSRYLGQRQDSLKDKKRAESDSKYQSKRKNFELKRFDYSTFMQDLHGGRKEQELLSQLTKYADGQAKSFLSTAKKVETLVPQLDALVKEVTDTDKEYNLQRTEREEKRRNLEKNGPIAGEAETTHQPIAGTPLPAQNGHAGYISDTDLTRADSTSSQFGRPLAQTLSPSSNLMLQGIPPTVLSTSPGGSSMAATPSKFKGIRDLDESSVSTSDRTVNGQFRKEGLLWALSKPGSHIDPVGINKQAWHKFWIVLDQGKLSEYSNWKDKLDLHREPIDLRMASVRMARDAERRFCFEVITPQYKRVYQATTEDEMNNWINAINNALQNAFEAGSHASQQSNRVPSGREYGSMLTGKSSSQSGPHGYSQRPDHASGVSRRITVGARPTFTRTSSNSYEENPSKLLDQIRNNDQANLYCADCGSVSKVEWVSLNLGIILCIECGGIHRSLGTHVSKIRSLTLDVHSFTNDIVELLMLIGNRISNMIWESLLNPSLKPGPTATREQRLKFITSKYVERAYVEPVSQYGTADDMLLTSIKRHDIKGVLQAIAQRANVNAHDRSRNTHAVFLALAAADPARPVSSHSDRPATQTVKAFPMAEMLVQNGAEIPTNPPAIPLSQAAQLYIEQRTSRVTTTNGGHGDTLGPLPMLPRISPSGSDSHARLQKRGSAGARFAGKVAGLGER